jgi:hypothetical protein
MDFPFFLLGLCFTFSIRIRSSFLSSSGSSIDCESHLIKRRQLVFCYFSIQFELSIKFKSFKIIYLFTYLGQLRYFSSLIVIFSLSEFPFQYLILSFCYYHTLSKQS